MRAPMPHCSTRGTVVCSEEGIALAIALIALALFSLLALYVSLSAANELRLTDNFESQVQARYAALTGLHHARAILRGLEFDDLLRGPDGRNSTAPEYVAAARSFAFRNPVDWTLARFLDSTSPERDLAGMPDDGQINTGACGPADGVVLIPGTGIAQLDAGGGDATVRARYFVKVTDNNGDVSELTGDSANDPFFDGDGTVLLRSMGIAPTIPELAGSAVRRNTLVVYEARFTRSRAFAFDAPFVVQGDDVRASSEPMFEGTSFLIKGESGGFGIATIDVDTADSVFPATQIRSRVSEVQSANIVGEGVPSIGDITATIASDPEKKFLLDAGAVGHVLAAVPGYADNQYPGDEVWGSAEIGSYDPALPVNHPSQKPLLTVVGGNLTINGAVSGAGLLVVKGRLAVAGSLRFCGLVLVLGTGELALQPGSLDLHGAVYVARLDEEFGMLSWGTPAVTVSGNTTLQLDRQAIGMALRLIPPEQRGFREVTATMDP